mgnify:CR=1 FL=1
MNKYKSLLTTLNILLIGLSIFVLSACPKSSVTTATNQPPTNPPFFKDIPPEQGPWRVQVVTAKDAYQKIYIHTTADVIIAATFARINDPINVDLTDPRNQKALAEMALNNFCKAIEAQCLADSSDIAWIVGTSLKYIYVRFHADKKGMKPLQGLLYYRFDQPFQTMYLLICDAIIYDNFETVFLNYLANAEFKLPAVSTQ